MLNADQNETAPASRDTSFDGTPVTATVSPTLAPAIANSGFGDPGNPAPTVTMVAHPGEPEDANADKSMTNWNAVSAFMANVVPWPGSPTDPGHVGLWYSMPNPSFDATKKVGHNNKKQFISGWPYRAVDQFVSRAGWVVQAAEAKFKDIWFCTSLQKKDALNKRGKPKAQKHAIDAVKLRSIWVDIDVKADDPKCYASRDEAWTAFSTIRKQLNLPRPSAVVSSGGGLQVWWISKVDLLPHEWEPYAKGLKALLMGTYFKFDPTCTADAARLMRVPGTFNHKYDPPRPVELLPFTLKLYDFAELDFLKAHAGVATAKTASAHQLFVDEEAAAKFTAGPVFKIEGEPDLQAGIDKFGDGLLDPHPIFVQCGFYREALFHGGKNNDNPQWNLAVLGTTFMEGGNEIAHTISSGHATYSKDDTQALFDRKLAERASSGRLGYPSCAAIKGAGCKACETCPLRWKVKSPLNLGYQEQTSRVGITTEGTFNQSNQYEPIDLIDPLLSKLEPQWLAMIAADDYSAGYGGNCSRAEFALVCEAIRVGIDDGVIARLLMDARRQFGGHTRDKPSYRLPRIINRGHDFAIDPDLADMNSEFFVAPIGEATRVVSMKDDPVFPGRKIIRAQSFRAFTDLHSNKRKTWETADTDGNTKVTKIPLGAWWLRQERRRQYDGGMAFMPQHDQDHVGDVLNTWRGFAVQPRKPEGSSGASGCNLMLDHIHQILCSGNEEHYDFFIKRLASIIQTRRRTEVALALATKVEGTGKGFYRKHVLSALLGPAHMEISNPEHLTGKHNQHLENLLSLCADEALFAGDPRHRNALYSLITEPMITVEPKFVGAYSAPNYLNIDILSNAEHYVPASSSARRFFVPTVSPDRAGDFEYFRKIEAQMKTEGGYEALLYHLQHEVNLRNFDVRKVPTTVGLREQARYSRKGVDLLVESVCNEGQVPCVIYNHPDCSFTNIDPTVPGSLDHMLSNSNDRDLQKPLTVKRRLTSEWGCTGGDSTRIWNGKNHDACIKWPPLSDLRAMFERRHGPQTWDRADVTEWRKTD